MVDRNPARRGRSPRRAGLRINYHVGRKTSVIGGEKELPNLFVGSHLAQSGFHPGARGGRQFFIRSLRASALLDGVFFTEVLRL